jgi:hypothetical protein
MEQIVTEGLSQNIASKITVFLEEILRSGHASNLHSFHIVGSALTPDFDEKVSDINSVIVFKEMDLSFVEFLAPLGKTYKKKRIGAPLIMTPPYIQSSLDVFPIELLDFKLIHKTLYGEDLFSGLEIEQKHLRLQCEREIKAKLIWLRQGYISSLGDKKLLSERFAESITGYMPLFKAIISLLGKEPPVKRLDVIRTLQEITQIETGIFEKMLLLRRKQISLSRDELITSFEQYYRATERIAKIVDELIV